MISEPFGTTRDGRAVSRHLLHNTRGTEAVFIDLGATLCELWLGGVDVVLGFDDLAGYEAERTWFGCVVGRVANRIAGARFELDGKGFDVEANEGEHHLHGGSRGLSTRVWSASPADTPDGQGIRFVCVSADGEGGYPGRVEVEVTYRLTDDDRLRIEYVARVDRATPVNLTHHAYFNLAGSGDVLGHELEIEATRIVGVDRELIPTGRLLNAAGTPYDFTDAKSVGHDLDRLDVEGYDVSYVLAGFDEAVRGLGPQLRHAATLVDPGSGRRMRVATTAPCVQLYTGQYLDGRRGKRGAKYARFSGLCLEAQYPPDALHQPAFPSVVCRPGAPYRQVTEYAFTLI